MKVILMPGPNKPNQRRRWHTQVQGRAHAHAHAWRLVCGTTKGFTLLEALVVLALLATLAGLAAPSFSQLRQKHQLQSQGEQLLASLMLARSEALRQQQRVTVCARAAGNAAGNAAGDGAGEVCASDGTWTQGWLVFVDGNNNALREGSEGLLQVTSALPAAFSLQGNTPVRRYVSYGPAGRSITITGAFQAGTLTLCQPGQALAWQVVINAVGKPRLEPAPAKVASAC